MMSPDQLADPNLVLFGKLALAALLGMIIGTERATAGKGAGTRTFALVALGACLFMVVGNSVDAAFLGIVNFEPMRIAASIVMGVGFLGAGLIIFQDHRLQGLTTAAGLWVVAALGVTVGAGMYWLAIYATALIVLVFTGVWFVENKIKRWVQYDQVPVIDPVTEGEPQEQVIED